MKIIKLLLLIITSVFILSSCTYDKGIILFNTEPITRLSILKDQKVFQAGNKIYYIFLAPQKMDEEFVRVQIFKMTDSAPWGGNNVVRTKDYRLMLDERYYHTDYFVLHEKGRYVMQVFSHNDFIRPLAINDFYVE